MCGTRRAVEGWQDECSTRMIEAGFVQGVASPCVFHHPTRNITCSVHGDDFTAAGPKLELDRFEATLKKSYELTVRGAVWAQEQTMIRMPSFSAGLSNGPPRVWNTRLIRGRLRNFSSNWISNDVKGVGTPVVKLKSHQVKSETELPE